MTNNMRSRFTVRSATGPSMCACLLLVSAGFLCESVAWGQGKSGPQRTFATAGEAAKALGEAYQKEDLKSVANILSDKGWRLVFSGDPVIDRHERAWFLSLYREEHEVVAESDRRAVLQLGKDEQPYPIPIVKRGKRWRFDPSEGHEDLLSRRISKAELSAVNVVLAYVKAQREYHQQDRKGDGVVGRS